MSYKSIDGPEVTATSPRPYRSELRQQQAAETRRRVVAAATELFAASGYSGTTLAKIAEAAGVSIETVQAQGSKAALLVAAIELAAVGVSDADDILDLDVGRRFLALTDRDEAIDFYATEQTAAHERSAAIVRTLSGAAANDPEIRRYFDGLLTGVGQQIRRLLTVCSERGWLRTDVGFDELVGTAVVLGSVETYLRLVDHEGWTVDAFQAWLRRALDEAVFAPPRRAGA